MSAESDLDSDDSDEESGRQLPNALHTQIVALSELANRALDDNRPQAAIEPLEKALKLLPPLEHQWEAWTWLNGTLGDAYFAMKNYKMAKIALLDARSGPGGLDNPFILLRLGEALFELGDLQQAKYMLANAHIFEGDQLFDDEDPKYLAFVLKP